MRIQNDLQSFNGIHIASANVKLNNSSLKYDLYKITGVDTDFLEELRKSLDLRKLYSGLDDYGYTFWQRILNSVLAPSCFFNSNTILLTKDNLPCGGLKYTVNRDFYNIEGRVTWPLEKDKREPFAGKVLLLELYNIFLHDNKNRIKTCTVRRTPFDALSKSIEMGFSSVGGDNYNELMSINRQKIAGMISKFKPIIEIIQHRGEEYSNLFDIINGLTERTL